MALFKVPYQRLVRRVREDGEYDPGVVVFEATSMGSAHRRLYTDPVKMTDLFDPADLRARFE